MQSFIVTWENSAGSECTNQVYAPDRDNAIWRLAMLMQSPPSHLGKFISCEPEPADNCEGQDGTEDGEWSESLAKEDARNAWQLDSED